VTGVLLPLAFAVGIAARRPVPDVSVLPAALAPAPRNFSSLEWDRADLFPRLLGHKFGDLIQLTSAPLTSRAPSTTASDMR